MFLPFIFIILLLLLVLVFRLVDPLVYIFNLFIRHLLQVLLGRHINALATVFLGLFFLRPLLVHL